MTKPVLLVYLIQIIAMEKVKRNKFIPHIYAKCFDFKFHQIICKYENEEDPFSTFNISQQKSAIRLLGFKNNNVIHHFSHYH